MKKSLKTIIWTYNSPLNPCSFNRKLNFDFFCLIPIFLSHGKRCFMSGLLFVYTNININIDINININMNIDIDIDIDININININIKKVDRT